VLILLNDIELERRLHENLTTPEIDTKFDPQDQIEINFYSNLTFTHFSLKSLKVLTKICVTILKFIIGIIWFLIKDLLKNFTLIALIVVMSINPFGWAFITTIQRKLITRISLIIQNILYIIKWVRKSVYK
jgi:hypothetical protein